MQTTARVWDAYLCEGAKVLVRVAIALVKARMAARNRAHACARSSLTWHHPRCPHPFSHQMNEAALSRCTDIGELVTVLKHSAAGAHDRDALLLFAFERIGSLPGARLERLRAAATKEVAAEREALAARRASRPKS